MRKLLVILNAMVKIAAHIVDHPLSRILLGLLGIAVFGSFGIIAVYLLALARPDSVSLGLPACLGLVGWFARLFLPSAKLMLRPGLQLLVCLCLFAGISTAVYTLFAVPLSSLGVLMLAAMVTVGTLMLLGTIGASGSGTKKSSKPSNLRTKAHIHPVEN